VGKSVLSMPPCYNHIIDKNHFDTALH